MAESEIVYRPGADNAVLRHCLWEAWGRKCYWCTRPLLDSTQAEIDHLIPRRDFGVARALAGQPESYELHAVENLAPICSAGARCNQRKPENISGILGPILTALDRAKKLAPAVRRKAERIRAAQGAEAGLLAFITSDIDEQIRGLGTEYGPQILQRLHAVTPDTMGSFTSSVVVEIDHPLLHMAEPDFPAVSTSAPGLAPAASLVVERDGRFALEAAERLYGVRVTDHLSGPLGALLDRIIDEVEAAVPSDAEGYDARSAFDAHRVPGLALELSDWEFDDGSGLTITIDADIHADFVTSTAVTDPDGVVVSGQLEVFTFAHADLCVTVTTEGADVDCTLSSVVIEDSSHTY